MKILDCMDYHFSWPYIQKLSEQMKNYLISLNIEEPIGIYLDVPQEVNPEIVLYPRLVAGGFSLLDNG